jgi:hypothetical protein
MRKFSIIVGMAALLLIAGISTSHHVSASAKVARIVADDAVIGSTADVTTVSSVTVPSGGASYRATIYSVVTAGSGNGGEINVTYTDDNGSTQVQEVRMGPASGLGAGSATFVIHAASGSVVVSTLCTQAGPTCGSTTNHTYNLYSVIEEL